MLFSGNATGVWIESNWHTATKATVNKKNMIKSALRMPGLIHWLILSFSQPTMATGKAQA